MFDWLPVRLGETLNEPGHATVHGELPSQLYVRGPALQLRHQGDLQRQPT